MDQIKAFISHSSDDALYVDVLINLIGKNSLVVDRFCFESGERTIDEIIKSIDNSAIFIVLLSRSSLDKDWVKKEFIIGQTKCALFTNEMCKKKIFFHAKLKAFNQCLNSV